MVPHFATRYETFEVLGTGGYGTVYRAYDHKLGRPVALKLFHGGATEVLAIKEARILTLLEGDHILRVFNVGVHQDIPFLATEIANQGSSEDLLAQGYGLRADYVVRWLRHLLVGLRVTHAAQLLHRDVTPSNLFLDSPDHARLGDFGVAAVDTTPQQAVSAAGNPAIQPPEGLATQTASRSSDIWGVGVTGWRLLTGSWPFEGPTEAERATAISDGNRPRLRDVAPNVPQRLALCVEKALSEDPTDRFASAEEMDADLARIPQLSRIWREVEPGPYGRLWEGASVRGGSDIEVRLTQAGPHRWVIETCHSASNRRITKHCTNVTTSRLPRRLRQVFDAL